MFTRAGFNHRARFVCGAMVGLRGRSWHGPAYLYRFVRSGEFAWVVSDVGIRWPDAVEIHPYFVTPWAVEARAPSSKLKLTEELC